MHVILFANLLQITTYLQKRYTSVFCKCIESCKTTKANDNIAHIHNRMTLMDSEIDWSSFNKEINDIEIDFYPVSTQVNYSKNDDKSLIEPLI